MKAHVRVHNGYPLVSVRYIRRDVSGNSEPDWSEEAILPISGYAAVLVRAIAAEGESPRRIWVEAVADQARLDGGAAVELEVWADGIGLAETALQGIATAVLRERKASGTLGLAGQTTVVARLFAASEAAPTASVAQQPVPDSPELPAGVDTSGSRLNSPRQGNGFGLSPPRLPGRAGLSRARPAGELEKQLGHTAAGEVRLSLADQTRVSKRRRARLASLFAPRWPASWRFVRPRMPHVQLHLRRPSVRIRVPRMAMKLRRPPLHGSRLVLTSGALATLAILGVALATWRAMSTEFFTPAEQLAATLISAAQTDGTASRSGGAGQPAATVAEPAAVAEPAVALVGADMTTGAASADVAATGVEVDAATSAPAERTPIGAQPAETMAAIPAPRSDAAPTAATPLATPLDGAAAPAQSALPTPLPAVAAPSPVQPLSAPRRLIDYSAPAALNPDWPNDQRSTAWFGPDGYHLAARRQGQFVAVGLHSDQHLRDVLLTATFHKTGGPTGGGYGLILRDQGPGPRDGLNQRGRYLVVEVGDRGEIGMWRRDDGQWIDLLPWTAAASVRPLNAENVIAFKAVGNQLTLSVNGTEVATREDATLKDGGAGVFLGGDDNQAVLTQLTLQTIE